MAVRALKYVFEDLWQQQEWKAKCVSTPKAKHQDRKPYLGNLKHSTDTYVQVYPSTIIRQAQFNTKNAYIRIGNDLAKQNTLAQGEHGSPLGAQCVSLMDIDLKHLRLLHMARGPTTPLTCTVTRVTRLLCVCVAQLMDDIATLIPYFTDDPTTISDADMAISEIYDERPTLTGVPTFPAPLILEKQTADQ